VAYRHEGAGAQNGWYVRSLTTAILLFWNATVIFFTGTNTDNDIRTTGMSLIHNSGKLNQSITKAKQQSQRVCCSSIPSSRLPFVSYFAPLGSVLTSYLAHNTGTPRPLYLSNVDCDTTQPRIHLLKNGYVPPCQAMRIPHKTDVTKRLCNEWQKALDKANVCLPIPVPSTLQV